MDLEKLYSLYLSNRQKFILGEKIDLISKETSNREAYAINLAMDKEKLYNKDSFTRLLER